MEMLYMTANELQRLRKINTAKIRFTIMNALHGAPWLSFFSAAYIIAKTNGTKTADFDSFLDEYKVKLNNCKPELEILRGALKLEAAEKDIEELEAASARDGFWNDVEKSQKVQKRLKNLKGKSVNSVCF